MALKSEKNYREIIAALCILLVLSTIVIFMLPSALIIPQTSVPAVPQTSSCPVAPQTPTITAPQTPSAVAAAPAHSLMVYPPMIATFDANRTILVYEIYLGNFTPLTIEKVEVFADGPSGAPLRTIEGQELQADYGPQTGPMTHQRVYLWLEFPQGSAVPSVLYHKIYVKNEAGTTSVLDPGPTRVRNVTTENSTIAVIGPPLKGDKWLTASAPSNFVGHRRAVFEFNGIPFIAQRYATDFLQYGASGNVFKTDGKTNADFYAYGQDIIAVADGTVVDMKDGLPDNVPGIVPTPTMATIGGNYVVLDIGGKHYAFYAHMIPWSIRVKIGDKVQKGDVIGLLGSSGNSGAPHLHFHIVSTKDAVLSDGEPYEFESYAIQAVNPHWGKTVEEAPFEWYANPIAMNHTMPVDGDIVAFQN